MKKNNLSFFRLDEQVIYTMVAVCLLSLLILGFKMISRKDCKDIIITSNGDSVILNSTVVFKASALEGKDFVWDFGDRSSTFRGKLASANHIYEKPGNYTISVVVNGECTGVGKVYIRPLLNKTKTMPEIIASKDTAIVGERIKFREASGSFTTLQWTFGDTEYTDPRTSPDHTFSLAGTVRIRLVANGDPNLFAEKEIFVMNLKQNYKDKEITDFIPTPRRKKTEIKDDPIPEPLPVTPDKPVVEEVKKIPEIKKPAKATPAQLALLITEIMDEKKDLDDLQRLLCENGNALAIVNGAQMSLPEMCNKLRKLKSKSVKNVQASATYDNDCLTRLEVSYQKKVLGIL